MTYKEQFPDFDAMPEIPADWLDSSWCNDLCPSFTVMNGAAGDSNFQLWRVWVDYEKPELRDIPTVARFGITAEEGESDCVCVFESEDWQSVLQFVELRRALAAAYVAQVGYNPFLDCPTIDPVTVANALAFNIQMTKES